MNKKALIFPLILVVLLFIVSMGCEPDDPTEPVEPVDPVVPIYPVEGYEKTPQQPGQNVFTFKWGVSFPIPILPLNVSNVNHKWNDLFFPWGPLFYTVYKNGYEIYSENIRSKPLQEVLKDISMFANDGDIVRLPHGTYEGPISIGVCRFSDTYLKELIVEAEPGPGQAIINCSGNDRCVSIHGELTALRGIKITGNSYSGISFSGSVTMEWLILEMSNTGNGVTTCSARFTAQNPVFRNNFFYGSGYSPFLINFADGMIVEKNIVSGNYTVGCIVTYSDDVIIKDNTFNDYGLSLQYGKNIVVKNNEFTGSFSVAINILASKNTLIQLNTINGIAADTSEKQTGIRDTLSSDTKIYGNLITNSLLGIDTILTQDIMVAHNTIATNAQTALRINENKDMVLINNILKATDSITGCYHGYDVSDDGTLPSLPCFGPSTIATNVGNWGSSNPRYSPDINIGNIIFVDETNKDYRLKSVRTGYAINNPKGNGAQFDDSYLPNFPNKDLNGISFRGSDMMIDPGAYQTKAGLTDEDTIQINQVLDNWEMAWVELDAGQLSPVLDDEIIVEGGDTQKTCFF